MSECLSNIAQCLCSDAHSKESTKRIIMIIKNFIKSLVLACLLITGTTLQAQNTIETSFKVSGICGMCEDRIEKAVDVKGVKMANYDIDTHTLSIAFNSDKITEDEIHALINAVGHDTDKSKASDAQYDTVHGCCKYRENDDH